jgi:hypothetical protein
MKDKKQTEKQTITLLTSEKDLLNYLDSTDAEFYLQAKEAGWKAEQERILEWIDRNRYAIEQLPENKYNSGRMQTLERIEYFVREGGIGTVGSDKEIEKLIRGEK